MLSSAYPDIVCSTRVGSFLVAACGVSPVSISASFPSPLAASQGGAL
jgi:hypothetical protein